MMVLHGDHIVQVPGAGHCKCTVGMMVLIGDHPVVGGHLITVRTMVLHIQGPGDLIILEAQGTFTQLNICACISLFYE